MHAPEFHARRPGARRQLALLLVAALLFAQALGLLHRVAHGEPGAAAPHAASVVESLLAHDADGASCRLYDALAGGSALPGGDAPAVAGAPPATCPAPPADRPPPARERLPFAARAPPLAS